MGSRVDERTVYKIQSKQEKSARSGKSGLFRQVVCLLACLWMVSFFRSVHASVALLFAFLALPAHAVVSMESLHLKTPMDGFSGEIDISTGGASGNTNKSNLAAGARVQWHTGIHTSFLVLNHAYGETNYTRDTNRSFLHARHIAQFQERLAGEMFAQAEQDEFARLEFRGLAGGGARLTLTERLEHSAAFLGLGAFYETETTTDVVGTSDSGTHNQWRGNLYLVLKYEVNDKVKLVSSTYYQPVLDSAGDFRLLENAALEVTLTERLALRISIEVRHDSRPPETVEDTDTTYRTGLQFKF